jgi:hypothetical protein
MVDEGMMELTGAGSPSEAWKTIIRPDDVVGIKSNYWNSLRTPFELEKIIKAGVAGTGVSEGNIGINDRGVLNDPVFKKATALINTRPMRTHALGVRCRKITCTRNLPTRAIPCDRLIGVGSQRQTRLNIP